MNEGLEAKIEVVLMVKHQGSDRWEGAAGGPFVVMPRVGEYIELEIAEQGCLYKVVSVHHPGEPAITAGDIFAVYAGLTHEVIKNLPSTP